MPDTPLEAEMPAEGISELAQQFSDEFDALCLQRHEMGAAKYGPNKFLGVDTMQEALEEIIDLSNYARYTFIKIRLIQHKLQQQATPGFTKTLDPNQS